MTDRISELKKELDEMGVTLDSIRFGEDGDKDGTVTMIPFLKFPPSYSPTKVEMDKARKIAGELFPLLNDNKSVKE